MQPSDAASWICWETTGSRSRGVTLCRLDQLSLDAARAAHMARAAGLVPSIPKAASCRLTFAEVCAAFRRAKRAIYADSTLSALGYYLETQLLPAFGSRKLSQIIPADVADWFYHYSHGRPGGANQALGHFRTIWNWGGKTGPLPVDLPNPASPLRFNKHRARGRMLNSAQLGALAKVLKGPRRRPVMLLMRYGSSSSPAAGQARSSGSDGPTSGGIGLSCRKPKQAPARFS